MINLNLEVRCKITVPRYTSLHDNKYSVVEWHISFPLMNSFNKTEAAIFECMLVILGAFPFISLIS